MAIHDIEALLDDGILIVNKVRVVGTSAKNEPTALAATRRAVLEADSHRREIADYLRLSRFKKLLIIGTSKRMIELIVRRLELSGDIQWIPIESLQSAEELNIARRERRSGHHVIPIYPLEIRSTYSRHWYQRLVLFFLKRTEEVTVVRPAYSRPEIPGGIVVVDVRCIKDIIAHTRREGWKIDSIHIEQHVQRNVVSIAISVPFPCTISDVHQWKGEVTRVLERTLGTPYVIHLNWDSILVY